MNKKRESYYLQLTRYSYLYRTNKPVERTSTKYLEQRKIKGEVFTSLLKLYFTRD